MGLLYGIGVRIMNFMVFFLLVILLPGLPPRTTFPFREFRITPTKELKGALESNNLLDGAERLLEGRVYGPECLISRQNEIYMGIHGGEVIKMNAGHVTHVTKIGQPCEDIFEEARCGRPLGLAFDTQGNNLIIADAYYGIWLLDLNTHKKKLLVSPQQQLPGKDIERRARIFNSVTVDKEGHIYWTDSSSDFAILDLVFTSFANPSGRLFKYDRSKNESKVLLDELFFANGVALSPNEDFVIVAESGAMRLMKYHLKGPNAGKSEVFIEGLPGIPDNLTPDADGLWVPLVMSADSEHPNGFSMFSRFPSIRLFLARMLSLFEMPFVLINNFYPNKLAERFIHFIGHGESILLLAPKRSTIVRLAWDGNIVGSLHGYDKSVGSISHVLEFNDQLLLGSPFNRFLAKVKSPSAKQHNVKIKNVRYEGANIEPVVKLSSSTTTAKPTTTTTTTPKPKSKATTSATTSTTPKPSAAKPATPKPTAKTATTPEKKQAPTTTTTKTPTTTAKPVSAKSKPTTPTAKPAPSREPAPVKEDLSSDTKPPKQEKLKVVDKNGKHVEL